jgi:hypothetical protein
VRHRGPSNPARSRHCLCLHLGVRRGRVDRRIFIHKYQRRAFLCLGIVFHSEPAQKQALQGLESGVVRSNFRILLQTLNRRANGPDDLCIGRKHL